MAYRLRIADRMQFEDQLYTVLLRAFRNELPRVTWRDVLRALDKGAEILVTDPLHPSSVDDPRRRIRILPAPPLYLCYQLQESAKTVWLLTCASAL